MTRPFVAVLLCSYLGCSAEVEPEAGADAALAAADAAPADAATRPDADPGAPTATLSGDVVRTTEPKAGGVGNLFIAVFESDPVVSMRTAAPVGQALVSDADMSADDAAIAYEVVGIPVRPEPYFIVAFLDDNGNATVDDPAAAGPDRGDLVSLQGLASPSVSLDHAGVTTYDIVLNIAMPF